MNLKNLGSRVKAAAFNAIDFKGIVLKLKIAGIVLLTLLFLAFVINIMSFFSSLFNVFQSYLGYSVNWNYSSLADKNLDTEQLSYDLLYETFYETISETSYYQVFNTKYTVQNQDGGGTFNSIRFGAFFKNTFIPDYLLSEEEDDDGNAPSGGAVLGSMVTDFMHNVFGTDNMDVRMTVHDANWRTISDMQKALAFSENADSDSKALEAQLGLFRDYYGRENDFALSKGLLKELNDKVLNIPEGNANDKTMIYPETFTKPVQFVKDYYRVKPVEVSNPGPEEAAYAFEDYTYITRRVLYEDLANGNSIPVTSGLMDVDDWDSPSDYGNYVTRFMDKYVTPKEILDRFNTRDYHGENSSDITLTDTYVDSDGKSKSLNSIFDLEGFITSVPSPYIYDYVVLERNNRKNFQSANTELFDYISMNNVSKYATIKEYNGYSENPTEKQVRLYWKMVSWNGNSPDKWEKDGPSEGFPNSLITSPINSSDDIINFTRNYRFTDVSNDEDKLGVPAGFFGTINDKFVYASAGVLNTTNNQYTFLIGPFASAADAESNNFIPAYKSDEISDNSSPIAKKLEGFSDSTNARIYVVYDDDGNYGYKIEYESYPVTRKVVEDNTEPFKTYSEPIEPENEEDPVTYYQWETATTPTHTKIITNAFLTAPEKKYQLAQLTDDNGNLMATSRVYFNIGEYEKTAVRDTYRRSQEYQSRLATYLDEVLRGDKTINEETIPATLKNSPYAKAALSGELDREGSNVVNLLKEKFKGKDLYRTIVGFFENVGAKWGNTAVVNNEIERLLLYDFSKQGHREAFKDLYSGTSSDYKPYVPDGFVLNLPAADSEGAEAQYNAKREELLAFLRAQGEKTIEELQEEGKGASFTMTDEEMAFVIYLFETNEVIPNGEIGVELEIAESFRDYVDTTGLTRNVYQELQKTYDEEFEEQFTNKVKDYMTTYGILSTDDNFYENAFTKDENGLYKPAPENVNKQDSYSVYETGNLFGNTKKREKDPIYSATLNPFPGYLVERTLYNMNNVGSPYSTVASSYTTGGGSQPTSSYAAASQVYSSAASAENLAKQQEDIKNNKDKYVSRIISTNLYSKYISSGYLPTSVSYSYGKKISSLYKAEAGNDTIIGWFKTKIGQAVDGMSGLVDDVLNSVNVSSASAGTGDMLVSIGAGEDNAWGYDISKETHKGETQLVNLFDNSFGQDMVQFYTGIDITRESKVVTNSDGSVRDGIWKLGQRFLRVIDSKAAYEDSAIGKAVHKETTNYNGKTYEIWRKEKLEGEYEYRVDSAILDLDKNRIRSTTNYEILPYEVRSVRDYGLASIMEYMEGLSVSFKRGLYYDETYTPYAANAFIYWLQQQQAANGTYTNIDVSSYEFDDTHKTFTDLERGFYPKEYMDIEGADGSELLKDKFILRDATKLGEDIGNGASGSVLSPVSEFMQGSSTTEPTTNEPTTTIDLSGDYSSLNDGAIIDMSDYKIFVYSHTPYLLLGKETTSSGQPAYQLANGDYTESFILIETEDGKYEKVSGSINGNQTVTGTFYDSADTNGIPTSGTVTNVDTIYLGPYYAFRDNSSFTSTINFNFFVPYKTSDTGPATYRDPKMYYLNWMVRANSDTNSNGERIKKNAAQQLAESRTYTLNKDMVTGDSQIKEINEYFRKDTTYQLPMNFASNLVGVNNAANTTFGWTFTTPENSIGTKRTNTTFNNGQDGAIYDYYLTGDGRKNTINQFSTMINDFDYINITSTESMFLISQVVTFLGRFEYTYKDVMETTGPLGKYDENRLIGLYYYDRYLQVNKPKYIAVYWYYGKFENSSTGYDSSDAKSDVESRINRNKYFGTLVDDNPCLLDEFKRQYQTYLDECNGDGYYWYDLESASITCNWTTTGPVDPDTGKATTISHSHSYAKNLVTYKVLMFEEISLNSNSVSPFIENWETVRGNPSIRIYDDLITYSQTTTYDLARSPMPLYTINEKLNNLSSSGSKLGSPMSIYEINNNGEGDVVDLSKQVSITSSRTASHDDEENRSFVLPYVLNTHSFMTSIGSVQKTEADVTKKTTISVECGTHGNSDEKECTYITAGTHEYGEDSVSMPVLMLLDSSNTNIGALREADKSIDTRTTGKIGPLRRNYFGSNWKIYLKEMKSYFDGETIPSWGDRVLYFDDDDFKGINPNYVTYSDDMNYERKKKTQYFDAYLAHFETYVPKSVKIDSDLAERIDLVQDFAKLTEDGKPWTTSEITDMFLNEAGNSYWSSVYRRWDTIFKEVGLNTMTDLQKQKAFAQILQGMWEARAERAVVENLKALVEKKRINIDSSREENKELMREIIKYSCGASADPGDENNASSLRGFIKNKKFYANGSSEADITISYEDIPYLGWACISLEGGESGHSSEAYDVSNNGKIREIYHLDSDKRYIASSGYTIGTDGIGATINSEETVSSIPTFNKDGFWIDDDSQLIHPIVIEYDDNGKIVKDSRLVATEMMPFISYRFLKNLNLYRSLQQAIFATVISNTAMDTLRAGSNGKDFTLSGDFNTSGNTDGEYLSMVLSFIQNKSVRQTVSSANIGVSSGWFVDMDSASGLHESVQRVLDNLYDDENKPYSNKYNLQTLKEFHNTYNTIVPGEEVQIPLSDSSYSGTKTITFEPWQGSWGYWQNIFKNVALNLMKNPDGGTYEKYDTEGNKENQAYLFDENGMGKVGERFVIATSSYLGVPGDYLDIYFEGSETPLKVIVGDCKSTGDDNIHKYGHLSGGTLNVIEFMVNWEQSKSSPVNVEGTGIWTDGSNQEFWPFINAAIGFSDSTKRNVVKVVNMGSYFIDPTFAGSSEGQSLYGVSSRSNIAAQLKKLSIRDYRSFAATAIQLVSRPQNLDDIEDIKNAAVMYKIENEKDILLMDEGELFGERTTFNILDLLGNPNGKGIYNKKTAGSLSYQWTGQYEISTNGCFDFDTVNWQEFEGDQKYVNLDVAAIALREAKNSDDENGRKYIEAYYGGNPHAWEYWCMEFVQWCLRQLGYTGQDGSPHSQLVPITAGCGYMLSNCTSYGAVVEGDISYSPPPGALIIYNHGTQRTAHVGIVIGCDENYVYTVEGDTTDPFGENAGKWLGGYNGYQSVAVKRVAKGASRITSYILIDYSQGTPCSLNEKLEGGTCGEIKPGSESYKEYYELNPVVE